MDEYTKIEMMTRCFILELLSGIKNMTKSPTNTSQTTFHKYNKN